MSLDYAPFSGSAEELLNIHEKEDRSGYEYHLHDATVHGKSPCLSFNEMKERFSGIPPQDSISVEKEKIHKWQLFTMGLALFSLLFILWSYNAFNPVVSSSVQNQPHLELPILTLCVPHSRPLMDIPHMLFFKNYALKDVRRPGDFVYTEDVHQYCNSTSLGGNSCGNFVEYDAQCLHVGGKNKSLPWNVTTGGETVLAVMLVYQSAVGGLGYSTRSLNLPYFGWNTTCIDEEDVETNPECAKQDMLIFTNTVKNPFNLYQLNPNHLTLAEINKEIHIDAQGAQSYLYPTSFLTFPMARDEFLRECLELDLVDFFNPFTSPLARCSVIFLGIRSLSRVTQISTEERYLFRVVRAVLTMTSQIAVISAICSFIFGFFVTRLRYKEKQAHLDNGLREAIIYMDKIMRAKNKSTNRET